MIIIGHMVWILNYLSTRFFKYHLLLTFSQFNMWNSLPLLISTVNFPFIFFWFHSSPLAFSAYTNSIFQFILVHFQFILWDTIYFFMVSNLYFIQPCSLSISIFYMYLRQVTVDIDNGVQAPGVKERKTYELNLNEKSYHTDTSMTEQTESFYG